MSTKPSYRLSSIKQLSLEQACAIVSCQLLAVAPLIGADTIFKVLDALNNSEARLFLRQQIEAQQRLVYKKFNVKITPHG